MEEDGEDFTPFWLQSTAKRRRTDRVRDGLSSLFFSSGLLIILLLVTAASFLVFVVPSTLSFSAQIFRPNTVKKSWDSLNVVLVLFALVFGLLSRATNQDRDSDEYQTSPVSRDDVQKSSPSTPQQKWYNYSTDEDQKSNLSAFQQWYGYSDQMADNQVNVSRGGLRRTSSSYPDLLEASSQFTSGDDPWRFYDDMTVDTYRVSETGQLLRRRSWKDKFEVSRVVESKNIHVDTFVNRPEKALSTPRPPSPPPPTLSASPPSLATTSLPMPKEKPKRVHRSLAHKGERSKKKDNELENREPISSPVTLPPPPPPLPALPRFVDQKIGKTDKKRSGGSATKDFLNSLYHKKKKKQRQKSIENLDSLLHLSQTPPLQFQSPSAAPPPAPPPPPPPPPSVFHNLFPSKKSKRKKSDLDISASTFSQPKPPTPTPAIHSKPSTSEIIKVSTHKSPKPVKIRSFDSVEENSNSGGESPLIPIPPPPPPPPPFTKSLSWKFVVQGDYVRVDSSLSSRSVSPDIDDAESDGTPTATDGEDAVASPPSPLFFPSPDVNTKAENFITKFRAGLKLEKINSMNKRQGLGLSNLGRGSDSTQL